MASDEDHNAIYNEDEYDEDVDDDVDSDADTNSTSSAAFLPRSAATNGSNPHPRPSVIHVTASTAAVVPIAATPVSERKPVEDSRRLFQRLWTDEDEIELLQGFSEYTAQRGPGWSGHHHDTTAFYDQIKSKIQLDCNKNQMVEKLRRLKKKYRTVVGRISSGKEFVFKSPHDQATFEISRKIWSNSIANRPELDEDDQNHPPLININLNSAGDHNMNSSDKMATMMNTGAPISRSRKRSRVKIEEKTPMNVNSGVHEAVNAPPIQELVEETVKSSLSPLLKELVDNAVGGNANGFSFVGGGANRIGLLALNAIPMNFPGANLGNGGGVMEERWRRQQILELELYSKRLELVQDQIKLAMAELTTRRN